MVKLCFYVSLCTYDIIFIETSQNKKVSWIVSNIRANNNKRKNYIEDKKHIVVIVVIVRKGQINCRAPRSWYWKNSNQQDRAKCLLGKKEEGTLAHSLVQKIQSKELDIDL